MQKFFLIHDLAKLLKRKKLKIGSVSGIRKAILEGRMQPPTGKTVTSRMCVWSEEDALTAIFREKARAAKYRRLREGR